MLRPIATANEDRDRRLVTRKGAGTAASIVQASRLSFPHLSIDRPGLVIVRRGRKHLSGRNTRLVFDSGMIAVFGGREIFDVINEPEYENPYHAEAIFPDPALLAAPAQELPRPLRGVAIIEKPAAEFSAALRMAIDAISDARLPESVAQHRVGEVLLWLRNAGLSIAPGHEAEVDHRIRLLIAADPAEDWSAAIVASRMAMSEATLRRRLSEKGTTLSAVMLDVRMSIALMLLQTTDDPVAKISLEVGYDSQSRFAARFRERFGFPPSLVRDRLT